MSHGDIFVVVLLAVFVIGGFIMVKLANRKRD